MLLVSGKKVVLLQILESIGGILGWFGKFTLYAERHLYVQDKNTSVQERKTERSPNPGPRIAV